MFDLMIVYSLCHTQQWSSSQGRLKTTWKASNITYCYWKAQVHETSRDEEYNIIVKPTMTPSVHCTEH